MGQLDARLAVLRGLPLWDCGRAASLLWLQFGNRVLSRSPLGVERETGEYALHVQCSWRFRGPEGIIVAVQDMYCPKEGSDSDREDFLWDQPDATLCDERMKQFVGEHCPAVVESVTADEVGGFQLFLSNGIVFEVFPDCSLPDEHWRLLRPASDESHLVFSGNALEEH